jgi:hypothetical protein
MAAQQSADDCLRGSRQQVTASEHGSGRGKMPEGAHHEVDRVVPVHVVISVWVRQAVHRRLTTNRIAQRWLTRCTPPLGIVGASRSAASRDRSAVAATSS